MSRIPGSGLKTWGGRYMTGGHYRVARMFARQPRRGQWRNYSTRAKASKALKLIRKFKKEQEVKHIDTSGSMTLAAASTGQWQTACRILLNGCSTGDAITNRDGNKIAMTDLLLRLAMQRHGNDTNGLYLRVVVFYDRKPNATAPTAVQLFNADANNQDVLHPLNRAYRGRFAILYDNFVDLDENTFYTTLKIYLKLTRVAKVFYNNTDAGDITDIEKGSLYLWVCGAGLDTADSTLIYNSRVKFTDS